MHKILEIITHPKCVELEGENISKVLSEWTWVELDHGFPHTWTTNGWPFANESKISPQKARIQA